MKRFDVIEDPHIQETARVMQTTMLDILQRRAVKEGLEYRAIEKKVPYETTLRVYGNDYLRSQFSDLRKFFDGDNRAYRVKDLTALTTKGTLDAVHDVLRNRWEAEFSPIANKYLFHLERGYIPPEGVSGHGLDSLIDDIDTFLNNLVHALTTAGYSVGYISRDRAYFQEIKKDAVDFFSKLGS